MRVFPFLAALAAGLVVLAAPAAGATGPSLTGGAKGPFPYAPDQGTVQFDVTARVLPDGSVQGRFHAVRHLPGGGLEAHYEGYVTCLTVSGNTATVTGVSTSGHDFVDPDFVVAGNTVALTVIDNGKDDLFALETSFLPFPHEIAPCQPARTLFAVAEEGGFVVNG